MIFINVNFAKLLINVNTGNTVRVKRLIRRSGLTWNLVDPSRERTRGRDLISPQRKAARVPHARSWAINLARDSSDSGASMEARIFRSSSRHRAFYGSLARLHPFKDRISKLYRWHRRPFSLRPRRARIIA